MAKIEMDVSEYETMKENKVLLQNALDEQKKLHEQINVLKEEKIKALEEASMKVVKISKSETRQFVMSRRESHEVVERVMQLVNGHPRHYPDPRSYINGLYDSFFSISEGSSLIYPPQITTQGLDEYKQELLEQLEKEQTQEISDKLKRAEGCFIKMDEIGKENKNLSAENKAFFNLNKDLIKENEDLKETNKLFVSYKSVISDVENILNSGYEWWNRGRILSRIRSVINKSINEKHQPN